ncbi:hypothetical protein R3P38DRAFT_2809078 [Favolaschia claudopus]|uniref:Uncharacterized protein n=1 Tax=Favolaschia claudopus TaxID=2862362 RepID=A0AAV9ZDV5_9AGAR
MYILTEKHINVPHIDYAGNYLHVLSARDSLPHSSSILRYCPELKLRSACETNRLQRSSSDSYGRFIDFVSDLSSALLYQTTSDPIRSHCRDFQYRNDDGHVSRVCGIAAVFNVELARVPKSITL